MIRNRSVCLTALLALALAAAAGCNPTRHYDVSPAGGDAMPNVREMTLYNVPPMIEVFDYGFPGSSAGDIIVLARAARERDADEREPRRRDRDLYRHHDRRQERRRAARRRGRRPRAPHDPGRVRLARLERQPRDHRCASAMRRTRRRPTGRSCGRWSAAPAASSAPAARSSRRRSATAGTSIACGSSSESDQRGASGSALRRLPSQGTTASPNAFQGQSGISTTRVVRRQADAGPDRATTCSRSVSRRASASDSYRSAARSRSSMRGVGPAMRRRIAGRPASSSTAKSASSSSLTIVGRARGGGAEPFGESRLDEVHRRASGASGRKRAWPIGRRFLRRRLDRGGFVRGIGVVERLDVGGRLVLRSRSVGLGAGAGRGSGRGQASRPAPITSRRRPAKRRRRRADLACRIARSACPSPSALNASSADVAGSSWNANSGGWEAFASCQSWESFMSFRVLSLPRLRRRRVEAAQAGAQAAIDGAGFQPDLPGDAFERPAEREALSQQFGRLEFEAGEPPGERCDLDRVVHGFRRGARPPLPHRPRFAGASPQFGAKPIAGRIDEHPAKPPFAIEVGVEDRHRAGEPASIETGTEARNGARWFVMGSLHRNGKRGPGGRESSASAFREMECTRPTSPPTILLRTQSKSSAIATGPRRRCGASPRRSASPLTPASAAASGSRPSIRAAGRRSRSDGP